MNLANGRDNEYVTMMHVCEKLCERNISARDIYIYILEILNSNLMRIYDVMLYRFNCGKVTFIQIKYM